MNRESTLTLFIDSADNKKTIIKLDDQEFITTYSSPRQQDVLGAIGKALKQRNKTLKDITSIEVNPGPGSFTGLRTGISIANTLSFALNIPVNNQPVGTTIIPNYRKKPNISP